MQAVRRRLAPARLRACELEVGPRRRTAAAVRTMLGVLTPEIARSNARGRARSRAGPRRLLPCGRRPRRRGALARPRGRCRSRRGSSGSRRPRPTSWCRIRRRSRALADVDAADARASSTPSWPTTSTRRGPADGLRRFRRRAMLRVAARDLGGAPLEDVVAEISRGGRRVPRGGAARWPPATSAWR